MIKNIHTIERRGDLETTFSRVDDYLNYQVIGKYSQRYFQIVDEEIKHWKDNKGALTLNDYFDDIELKFKKIDASHRNLESDSQILLYLQFVLEFMFILEEKCKIYSITETEFTSWALPLVKMIKERLELSNYTFNVENEKVYIHKRNPEIDSAILVVNDKQILNDILSFNDIRIENNLNEKKAIITRFYKFLESDKYATFKELRLKITSGGKDIKLFNNFFMIANNFDIRHFPANLKKNGTLHKLNDDRTVELLNLEYRIFLRIINSTQLIEDQDYVEKLLKEFNLI